jgi:hypothetical protein
VFKIALEIIGWLTIALVLAIAWPVQAASQALIPSQFHGSWCDQANDGLAYRRVGKDERCETREQRMTVSVYGYREFDTLCAASKVSKSRTGYRIKFRCVVERLDHPEVFELSWKVQGDTLSSVLVK